MLIIFKIIGQHQGVFRQNTFINGRDPKGYCTLYEHNTLNFLVNWKYMLSTYIRENWSWFGRTQYIDTSSESTNSLEILPGLIMFHFLCQ